MTPSGSFERNTVLRRYWYAVATEDDIRDGPVARTLLGERIVVFRARDGEPVALPDSCPHRNSPLSPGTAAGGRITCPYHGWTFDSDGTCVLVPSAQEGARIPPTAHLRPYRAAGRYGLVWVALDEPADGIPACTFDGDPGYRRITGPMSVWSASATRIVDNFLDISHIPWVHQGTFGSTARRDVPLFQLRDVGDGFHGYCFEVTAANLGVAATTTRQPGEVIRRTMTVGYRLPFAIRTTIRYDDGLEHNLYLLTTPIDDVTSYLSFVVWRKDDFTAPAEEVIALDLAIAAEDKAMLERIPGPLPLDSAGTVSVQSDRASVAWRRQLAALLDGSPPGFGARSTDLEAIDGIAPLPVGPHPATVDARGAPSGRR